MTAATATANRAPTEAEIRAIIKEHLNRRLPDPWDFAAAFTSTVDYIPEDERANSTNNVWTDLRPSQGQRLDELLSDVFDLASREMQALEAKLVEATVKAALKFAVEYPDAPRAEREPSNVESIEDGAMAVVSRR